MAHEPVRAGAADDESLSGLARMLRQLRRREARQRGGPELTYRTLAARTGWSQGIITHYFTGKTLPPTDRFDVLVRLLGASPAEQGALATVRDRVDERRRQVLPGDALVVANGRGVRLLGPVEAVGPAGTAILVGVRQRALVGLLALQSGTTVAQSRLIDALWGETPPRTAVRTLYSHVARVRQALEACGLPGVLVTRAPGYLLDLRPDEVDAVQFELLAARGRRALAEGEPADAAAHLRDGLALWRGAVLEGADPVGWGAAEALRLTEARLCALEDLWDAQLRLGEHATAVGEIERLLSVEPGRERLVGLLMTALYRVGRPAGAIEAYARLRRHLADQLGVEPGPQLRQLHTAVLRRDPGIGLDGPSGSGTPRPAQLPPQAGYFTGRVNELGILDKLVGWQGGADASAGPLGLVVGPAGMGKTALALHWAHRAANRFPDGQLFLDLGGHDPSTAMPAAEALLHLLRGLGIPAPRIPTGVVARVGLYRSTLHRRRLLILLDNAGAVDQVAGLVPPDSASLLIMTSRNHLAGLAVEHEVNTIDLDVLTAEDASVLLGRVLGPERVDREPLPARHLAELCGRMPLALRIAAAKLASRPRRPIAELVADLTGPDRLGTLTVRGDSRSVRTVFASAYKALSPPAARLFRRLGHHPGPTFTAHLAAAAGGVTGPAAQEALDELATAHLVTEVATGRYRFHDLIRLHAAEQAVPAEGADAVDRIFGWYLMVADAANRALEPHRDRVRVKPAEPGVEPPFPVDSDRAPSYMDDERANFLPVVRHAAGHGQGRIAWQLCYLLTSYYTHRGYWSEQVELCREGLAAARRPPDPDGERLMLSGLGVACCAIRNYEEALVHLRRALELMRECGDRRGQGMVLNNVALAHCQLGDLESGLAMHQQALDLHAADGHHPGVALALANIGDVHTSMGEYGRALDHLNRALTLAREVGNPHLEAGVLQNIGEAQMAAGNQGRALAAFGEALTIRRRIGERWMEAETSNSIGLVHRSRGEHASARRHFRRALALSREIDDRDLETATLAHLAGIRAAMSGENGHSC
ncbi:BTAD domain-containing putative transcriptional regulator [Plantactinospora sp. KBS50]|uniref:BTAD domain-containing putative transcriptional regulator n=1 Tax=Plantactinospora sp. KBS50 TaxID=2024580 RepID=UPI000BAB042E|nr:BTAD domain-containing putative transcriptional regulator [Plantactinospora sp. KBS50]ASW52926.1 hypothetical protein CIK06_00100 [Plantactinospora sp. KBS50]